MNNTENIKPKLVVILGPTAVGKTRLGIEIAKNIGASIISADSLQVYKFLDIGTAKPTLKERENIPHYLIDILDPDEDFNAGSYRKVALKKIDQLLGANEKIVVVGGTFLYVKVLLSGLLNNIEVDQKYRKELKTIRDEKGTNFLHEMLLEIDPESASKINKNDYVRIERALEVYHVSGELMSAHQSKHAFQDIRFDSFKIGLHMEREQLRNRIDLRVDKMIDDGFVEEVKLLREKGYGPDLKSMQSIGYKQINQYLDNNISYDRAVEIIKRDSKRFAKRQMTWLRADDEVQWFDSEKNSSEIIKGVIEFFQ